MKDAGSIRAIVGCEFTGMVRRALRAVGVQAWSCDLREAEDGSPWHIRGDIREHALQAPDGHPWDLGIMHPVCTRLTNAGVRWLSVPPPGRTLEDVVREMHEGAALYLACRDAPIAHKAIENPIMHIHARRLIQPGPRQVVQPWHFGDPEFKAIGLELIGLPRLVETNRLVPPKGGTDEHKRWSRVHRMPPGPNREAERSRFFPGVAAAMATQWTAHILQQRAA